jgi:hypothetical protein
LTRRGRLVVTLGVVLLAIGLLGLIASVAQPGDSVPDVRPSDSRGAAQATQPAAPEGPRPSRRWDLAPARQALAGEIAAYARPYVLAGEPLGLHVSTSAEQFEVVAYRIGHYGGKGGARVGRWGPFPGGRGEPATADPETGAVEAAWPVRAEIGTRDWEPGLYVVGVWTVGELRRRATVPVVVASRSAEGRVLVVAGDTTWQAYNEWGGVSAYKGPDGTKETRSRAVSFARPYAWSGYRWPAAFDIPLVRTAEAAGVPLAYASVTSLNDHPGVARGAEGIVSTGHDEYWTAQYRQALIEARDAGTDLAFLGANAGYWRTEMRDDGWTAWMPKEGRARRWRDDPGVVAENAVTGQLYDCYPARADMVIADPGFFLFEGTEVARGTRLRNLVGNESDRFYPLPSTPRPIEAPALSPVDCKGSPTWSTMTYYSTGSGAGVLSVGTLDWVRAMGGPRGSQGLGDDSLAFTRTVTTNLLQAMAAGRMGDDHPATDRFEDLDLPAEITSRSVLGTPDNPDLP